MGSNGVGHGMPARGLSGRLTSLPGQRGRIHKSIGCRVSVCAPKAKVASSISGQQNASTFGVLQDEFTELVEVIRAKLGEVGVGRERQS
jgi:hypothetical protein